MTRRCHALIVRPFRALRLFYLRAIREDRDHRDFYIW